MPFYDCAECGRGTFPWHPRPSTEQLRAWRAEGRSRAAGRGVCVNCYKRYRAAGRLDDLGHTRHTWREAITDAWFWANNAWELQAEAVSLGYVTELREYAEGNPRPQLKDFMIEFAAPGPTSSPTLTLVQGSASAEQHSTSKGEQHSTGWGRNTMGTITGEAINIEATRSNLVEIAAQATSLTDAIEQMSGHLQQADLDGETLGEIAALSEAVELVQARANRARDVLNRRHSQMEEAVNSTAHVAQTSYYRGA